MDYGLSKGVIFIIGMTARLAYSCSSGHMTAGIGRINVRLLYEIPPCGAENAYLLLNNALIDSKYQGESVFANLKICNFVENYTYNINIRRNGTIGLVKSEVRLYPDKL